MTFRRPPLIRINQIQIGNSHLQIRNPIKYKDFCELLAILNTKSLLNILGYVRIIKPSRLNKTQD